MNTRICVVLLTTICLAVAQSSSKYYGSFLEIEILKDGYSELRKTILGMGEVVPLSGTAPFPSNGGISGELVPFQPLDACSNLQSSNFTRSNQDGVVSFVSTGPMPSFVALVGPGGCTLSEKLINVQSIRNVVGVLLYAERNANLSTISGKMISNASIPGFIISNSLGEDLLRKIVKYKTPGVDDDFNLPDSIVKPSEKDQMKKSGSDPWIKITFYYQNEATSTKGILLLIMLILVVFLSAAFLGSLLLHFQAWRMQRREFEENSRRRPDVIPNLPAINQEFLDKLPRRTFSKNQMKAREKDDKAPIEQQMPIHWANDNCPICLDDFRENEQLNELPCGHAYHGSCVRPWLLNQSPCCPLCKIDSRVGVQNAILIQMGKEPNLPQIRHLGFLKFFLSGCWSMMCCNDGASISPCSN